MNEIKTRYANEGMLVILIGVFFLILALTVPANPVVLKGWVNVLAQAKMIPLVTSICTILFGIKLMLNINRGSIVPVKAGIDDKKNMVVVLLTTLAYLITIIYFGFLFPTIAYFALIIYILNRRTKSIPIMIIYVAVYTIVTMYIVPMAINIRLP